MKGPVRRKCLCCQEFYRPDHRNLRHQRYCSEPACRKESKAQSQRRWLQRPENENYFRGPDNSRRIKQWRKRNPGYWRKKKSSAHTPLQEVCQEQLAVVVGLISMMTGNSLQEDIAETARVLVRKGRDILQSNPGWEPARFSHENQTSSVSKAAAPSAASV